MTRFLRIFREKLSFFRERQLVTLALCYGLGVVFAYAVSFYPVLIALGLIFSVGIIVLLALKKRPFLIGFCSALFFLGMLLCGLRLSIPAPEGGKYTVKARVAAEVIVDDETGRQKTYLDEVTLTDVQEQTIQAGKAYFTWTPNEDLPAQLQVGDIITFTGTVYHPSNQQNPYGYDFQQYMLTRGVSYGISCYGSVEVAQHNTFTLNGWLISLRTALIDRCRQIFGQESAIPEALLLGYRSDLPDETNAAFSDAGVAHILAVSGLHVTLIAGFLIAFLRLFHLSPKARLICVAVFLFCYSALIGFSAPVVRASLLTVILMLAAVARRRVDPLTTLSCAFILILLFDPLSLFTASFQLSFSAVLGIIILGDRFSAITFRHRIPQLLWQFWQTTFAATCGVAIPVICYFHRLSLIGFVINPFVCLLMGVLMPLYAVIYLIGLPFLSLGTCLGSLIAPVTRIFAWVIAFFASLPAATVQLATPGVLVILFIVAAFILFSRYCCIRRMLKRILIPACVLAAVLIQVLSVDHSLRYVQLSIGQADAAVVIDDRETVIIDTGENGGDLSAYLLSMGLSADTVIITHLHMDHFGGVESLLDQGIQIGRVILPSSAEAFASQSALALLSRLTAAGIPIQYASRGDVITTPRASFTVLWPEEGRINTAADANNYSMALLANLDGVRFLCMSDVPTLYENYCVQPADILKVSHHGSKSGTGDQFLQSVSPSTAIIAASRFSTTLPSQSTLDRLSNAGVSVLRNDLTGCLTIRCQNSTYTITAFRGYHGS